MWTLASVSAAIYAADRAAAQGISPWRSPWFVAAAISLALGLICFVAATIATVQSRRRKPKTPREDPPARQTAFAAIEGGGGGNRYTRNLVEGADFFIRSGGRLDDTVFEDNTFRTLVAASGGGPIILPKERMAELQSTCSSLSQELVEFIYRRKRDEPKSPHSSGDHEAFRVAFHEFGRQLEAHGTETIYLYERHFGDRVRFAAKLAADNGYRDDRLLAYSDNPTNALGVKKIAQMLGAISERIKYDIGP
jgi:hypothetical protein